jgi:hypothetical protein
LVTFCSLASAYLMLVFYGLGMDAGTNLRNVIRFLFRLCYYIIHMYVMLALRAATELERSSSTLTMVSATCCALPQYPLHPSRQTTPCTHCTAYRHLPQAPFINPTVAGIDNQSPWVSRDNPRLGLIPDSQSISEIVFCYTWLGSHSITLSVM